MQGATAAHLTPHALAARLSYFLWQTAPDAELLKAADEGALADANEGARQVRRLIDSPAHERRDVPFALFGSGGGNFRTGRFIDCKGRPHNELLLSLVHAMGLTSKKRLGTPSFVPGRCRA